MNIVIHWIQTDAGGVDTQLLAMLREWPDKNDHFTLCCNTDNLGLKRIKAELEYLEVDIELVPATMKSRSMKILAFLFFPFYFLYLKTRAVRELNKLSRVDGRKIDAVIVQNGVYPGAWESLAMMWASSTVDIKKRMLIVHHGALHNNIIRRPGESFVDLMMHSWCTDIVCVSRATRETLITHRGFDPNKNPIRVVHNGIEFTQPQDNIHLSNVFRNSEDKILIGIVGRIERYKGHEDLILALDELDPSEQEKYQVFFIGSGSDSEILRLREMSEFLGVEKNITFTGYLLGEAIDVIRHLDILMMLTKDFEGFGLTIAEAMYAKTPVIATKVGAVPEFVDDRVATLVHPESPEDIAKVLRDYLKESMRFTKKIPHAYQHIQNYSSANMSWRYYRLLKIGAGGGIGSNRVIVGAETARDHINCVNKEMMPV